jgi:hypothetical protein
MSSSLLVHFYGGDAGDWKVTSSSAIRGEPLAPVARLRMSPEPSSAIPCMWTLRGTTSHLRYTTKAESARLAAVQPPLARPEATRAALIPIRKSPAWWDLAQDERRQIYEEQSNHTSIGLEYLPRIARRLHHSRDLKEPFDFLTWFEFAPEHEPAFDHLLARLRASAEWQFVERESEIRVSRSIPA